MEQLILSLDVWPQCLDPLAANDISDRSLVALTQDSLLDSINHGGSCSPSGNYEFEVSLSPDGRWEDGTLLNAFDYLAQFERLNLGNPRNITPKSNISDPPRVTRMTVISAYCLRLTTNFQSRNLLLALLGSPKFTPWPRWITIPAESRGRARKRPLCSGPWKTILLNKDTLLIEPNQYHQSSTSEKNNGLQPLRFTRHSTTEVATKAIFDGRLDISCPTAFGPESASRQLIGTKVISFKLPILGFFLVNSKRAQFLNAKQRSDFFSIVSRYAKTMPNMNNANPCKLQFRNLFVSNELNLPKSQTAYSKAEDTLRIGYSSFYPNDLIVKTFCSFFNANYGSCQAIQVEYRDFIQNIDHPAFDVSFRILGPSFQHPSAWALLFLQLAFERSDPEVQSALNNISKTQDGDFSILLDAIIRICATQYRFFPVCEFLASTWVSKRVSNRTLEILGHRGYFGKHTKALTKPSTS